MSNKKLTELESWKALENHQRLLSRQHISTLFKTHPKRAQELSFKMDGLLIDFSKQRLDQTALSLLCDLAHARGLGAFRDAMFSGEKINITEGRAVLHTALRSQAQDISVDGKNIMPFVRETKDTIKALSDKIRADASITDVINIGIGGSDLGPKMVCRALKPHAKGGPRIHFISNVDASALSELFKQLKPEHTALVIASKTLTTLETLTNAHSAKAWLEQSLPPDILATRIFAISNNRQGAVDFGAKEEHILPMADWVGGRFSLWGSIGFSIAISGGYEMFHALLEGARHMDEHFQSAPFAENLPVLLALTGIWNRNFEGHDTLAILPYAEDFFYLPSFLQQLDMESNGKAVSRAGAALDYGTGPIIFGEPGTNAQHAFMQLLHQSAQIIPSEFIIVAKPSHDMKHHHIQLISNALAQSKALMEGAANTEEPHRNFPGNRPSTTIVLDTLDAYHLGMLIALYEHKIFVQGAIWDINSFDQWGVELGKSIAKTLIHGFETGEMPASDASTQMLAESFHSAFIKS